MVTDQQHEDRASFWSRDGGSPRPSRKPPYFFELSVLRYKECPEEELRYIQICSALLSHHLEDSWANLSLRPGMTGAGATGRMCGARVYWVAWCLVFSLG